MIKKFKIYYNNYGGRFEITNDLADGLFLDRIAPSVTLMKTYINSSLSNIDFGGIMVGPTGAPGQDGLDGKDGSGVGVIQNGSVSFTEYDTLNFTSSDFSLTRTGNTINIKSTLPSNLVNQINTIATALSSDTNLGLTVDEETTFSNSYKLRSTKTISIRSEHINNSKHILFKQIKYNDMFTITDSPLEIVDIQKNIVLPNVIVSDLFNASTEDSSYTYTGDDMLNIHLHMQFKYDWVAADLPYKFILNVFKLNEDERTDLCHLYVGGFDLENVFNLFNRSILCTVYPGDVLYFNIHKCVEYTLRLLEDSFIYIDYNE